MAIAQAGAIEPFVALLRSGSAKAQEKAAQTLGNLACNAENKVAITQAGAIEPLEALARDGGAGAQTAAAWALTKLAAYPRIAGNSIATAVIMIIATAITLAAVKTCYDLRRRKRAREILLEQLLKAPRWRPVKQRPTEPGDICIICFDELGPDTDLTHCRWRCGRALHAECMNKWLLRRNDCVFCQALWRSPLETMLWERTGRMYN